MLFEILAKAESWPTDTIIRSLLEIQIINPSLRVTPASPESRSSIMIPTSLVAMVPNGIPTRNSFIARSEISLLIWPQCRDKFSKETSNMFLQVSTGKLRRLPHYRISISKCRSRTPWGLQLLLGFSWRTVRCKAWLGLSVMIAYSVIIGSGGFVSDLTFFGGNIGFRAGSQQFTARNLKFTSCLTAISMVWDWGFTWKNIDVLSCYIALDCTLANGANGQGTGSISVVGACQAKLLPFFTTN